MKKKNAIFKSIVLTSMLILIFSVLVPVPASNYYSYEVTYGIDTPYTTEIIKPTNNATLDQNTKNPEFRINCTNTENNTIAPVHMNMTAYVNTTYTEDFEGQSNGDPPSDEWYTFTEEVSSDDCVIDTNDGYDGTDGFHVATDFNDGWGNFTFDDPLVGFAKGLVTFSYWWGIKVDNVGDNNDHHQVLDSNDRLICDICQDNGLIINGAGTGIDTDAGNPDAIWHDMQISLNFTDKTFQVRLIKDGTYYTDWLDFHNENATDFGKLSFYNIDNGGDFGGGDDLHNCYYDDFEVTGYKKMHYHNDTSISGNTTYPAYTGFDYADDCLYQLDMSNYNASFDYDMALPDLSCSYNTTTSLNLTWTSTTDGKVILRPNDNGSSDDWNTGSTYNWQAVDDISADGDDSFIRTDSDGDWDSYNIQDFTAEYTIEKVTIYAELKGDNSETCKITIYDGTSTEKSSDFTPATSYDTYSNEWTTNPFTSLAWTETDINELEIGLEYTGAALGEYIYATQLYLEVEYDLPTVVIERKESPETSWAQGEGDEIYNGTDVSFSDTGLWPDTEYYYQLWTYTDGNYSALYSGAYATTTSGSPNEGTYGGIPEIMNETYLFTYTNGEFIPDAPSISHPTITNATENVSRITADFSITINQSQGYNHNWTMETVPDIGNESGNNSVNSTHTVSLAGQEYGTLYTIYINATVYNYTASSTKSFDMLTFTTETNNAPVVVNCSPTGGLMDPDNVSLTPDVYLNFTDDYNETQHITWYWSTDNTSWAEFATNNSMNETSCPVIQTMDNATDTNTTYYIKINITDEYNATRIHYFNFTTLNGEPSISLTSPTNNSVNYTVTPAFICSPSDPNNDPVTVQFYWSNHTLFYQTVTSDATCTVLFEDLLHYNGYNDHLHFETNYSWYVNVTDSWGATNTSDTFNFTTETGNDLSIFNEAPQNNTVVDLDMLEHITVSFDVSNGWNDPLNVTLTFDGTVVKTWTNTTEKSFSYEVNKNIIAGNYTWNVSVEKMQYPEYNTSAYFTFIQPEVTYVDIVENPLFYMLFFFGVFVLMFLVSEWKDEALIGILSGFLLAAISLTYWMNMGLLEGISFSLIMGVLAIYIIVRNLGGALEMAFGN